VTFAESGSAYDVIDQFSKDALINKYLGKFKSLMFDDRTSLLQVFCQFKLI
jgi:hypothetical protein